MTDGHEPTLEAREIPPPLSEQFRISLGFDRRPETLADWTEATARLLDDRHVPARLEELCLTETSRHEARVIGETLYFKCFFDMLLVPFVSESASEVQVRSRSLVSDTLVTGTVTPDEVSIEPDGAVMSFGAATDVVSADYLDVPATLAYRRFCPYIDAFPDESEYERWDKATESGVTMPLELAVGFALARRLVGAAPFDP